MVNHDLPDAPGFRKREHHGVITVQNIDSWGRRFPGEALPVAEEEVFHQKNLMKEEGKDLKFYHFLNMLYIFYCVKMQKLEHRASST